MHFDTFKKHFKEEIENGKEDLHTDLLEQLDEIAQNAKHPKQYDAVFFLLKTRCGYKETSAMELTGKDGAALVF